MFTFAPPASTFSSCKGSSVGGAAANESNVSSDRVEFRETTGPYPLRGSPFVSQRGGGMGGTNSNSLRSTKLEMIGAGFPAQPLDSLVHEIKSDTMIFSGN